MVSPIHEAQVVRGDDGMDHLEYELLIVTVFPEPVTLSNVTVLIPEKAADDGMTGDGVFENSVCVEAARAPPSTRRSSLPAS
jgi:hypothetical protein